MHIFHILPLLVGLSYSAFPFGPSQPLPSGFCCVKNPSSKIEIHTTQRRDKLLIQPSRNPTQTYGRYELQLLWIYLREIMTDPQTQTLQSVDLGNTSGTSAVHVLAYGSPKFGAAIPSSPELQAIRANHSALDPLSFLRATSTLLFSLLQQGNACSTNVPMYNKDRCPVWMPPEAPSALTTASSASAPIDSLNNQTAARVAHNLLAVINQFVPISNGALYQATKTMPIRMTESARFACAGWYCLTTGISSIEDEWAMDSVKTFFDKLMNSLTYLGGGMYPGILKRYYPRCMILNTGCTSENNAVKFFQCLEGKRNFTLDWGTPPPQESKTLVARLPMCDA